MSLDAEWEAQDAAWHVYAHLPTVDMTAQEVMDTAVSGDANPWRVELECLWMHDRFTVLNVLDSVVAEGFRTPILIGPDGRLWDGHHRLAVALALGISVPVRRIPGRESR